jgi:hypothetical protein
VIERDKADLRRQAVGLGDEPLERLDELLVKDVAQGDRDALASPIDVRGDRLRGGDHLVLEAGVELHVSRLVDLLG